jgi:transposase
VAETTGSNTEAAICALAEVCQPELLIEAPEYGSDVDNAIVHLFHARQWKKRRIARELGVSRNKVRRVLRKWEARRDYGAEAEATTRVLRARKIDPWIPTIMKLLEDYENDITAVRIHEELCKKGFDGGATIVKDAVRQLKTKTREPEIRFETAPGEQAQMDWGDCKIPFTSGVRMLKCFSFVLGYSRRLYIAFCPRADFFSLIRRHVEAFKYMGGCTATILYDCMKTVVLRWEGDTPIFNPRFLVFATHYRFRPRACRPRRPKTKGKIENPIKYVKGNLLCGRRFDNIDHLSEERFVWLETTANVRIHRTTRRRPIDLWREELPCLLPLPNRPYDTCKIAYRLASPEGLVAWDGNEYSVPQAFIGDFAVVKGYEHEIIVFSSALKEIARHELVPAGQGLKQRLPAHRIRRRKEEGEQLDLLRQCFLKLGDFAKDYLVGLARVHPRNLRSHICHILQLREAYNTNDVIRAIKHSLKFQAFDHGVVERILISKAKPRSLEAAIAHAGRVPGEVEETRPTAQQREGSFYQTLFERNAEQGEDEHEEYQNPHLEQSGCAEDDGC